MGCSVTSGKWYSLPSHTDLQSSEPQFEDGSVYRQNRPTSSFASSPVCTAVKQLRRKLGDDAGNATSISNKPRIGYRMPEGKAQERAES